MNNPFYNAMQRRNPMNMMGQFRQNPLAALRQAGYNLPANINDPHQMVKHLVDSGQLTQQQFDNIQNIARRMGARF